MAAIVQSERPRTVILRSLALGVVGYVGAVLVGIVAIGIAAVASALLAPQGRRVLAVSWALVGGLAVLVLVSAPFWTPASLSVSG